MDFLIVGNGMFGAAIARHLAPYAKVTVVGPEARADGSGGYGAHHDDGRIIGDLSRDLVWSELNRRARDGMTELDPALIMSCGALTATTRDGPGYLSVAAQLREYSGADIRTLTADAACTGYPMIRFGPDEMILHQPAAGHFSPRRYVALYRTVLGLTGLGRHRPAPVPQASGEVRGLSDDGDADHSGGESFAGHKPEQHAEPDADGVGNDAGGVRHICDDLSDGSDLKDRTDDAEQHRADTAPSVGDDHAPLPYRDLGHD